MTMTSERMKEAQEAKREMDRLQSIIDEADPSSPNYEAALLEQYAAERRYVHILKEAA